MADLQKSKGWDVKKKNKGRFTEKGFPFTEGFPRDHKGKTFTVIVRNGEEYNKVRVDDSCQYRAEGLQWRSADDKLIYGHVVVCWIEEV